MEHSLTLHFSYHQSIPFDRADDMRDSLSFKRTGISSFVPLSSLAFGSLSGVQVLSIQIKSSTMVSSIHPLPTIYHDAISFPSYIASLHNPHGTYISIHPPSISSPPRQSRSHFPIHHNLNNINTNANSSPYQP